MTAILAAQVSFLCSLHFVDGSIVSVLKSRAQSILYVMIVR